MNTLNPIAYDMFANRLEKMYKHIRKWARRQGITCYRVYDRDIPQFPFCIETYNEYLHISEFKKESFSLEDYLEYKKKCVSIITKIFGVEMDRIFIKTRERQKQHSQYNKFNDESKQIEVFENGHRFIINLSDYLDTGLFLDHRITRSMVKELSKGKDVLNLFCYTGSFTVYAVAGGAKSTLSIDLSNTYLDWTYKNLQINSFSNQSNELLRADIIQYLPKIQTNSFDLIVMDPPTFSKSKSMSIVLDIQRDYSFLINEAIRILRPNGILFFSTNLRTFKLESSEIHATQIRDITKQTIPKDFRNEKIHKCYQIV